MLVRRRLLIILILSLVATLSLAFAAEAQQQEPKTCPIVVSESLTALGTNCADLSRNSSCYGHDRVQHTAWVGSVPQDFYTVPGDRAPLSQTRTIQTGPFNLRQEYWGLNIMNVDANVPYALSPKGVVYVQFGGVEVENGVRPESAVQLVDGITASTISDTDLLTWPAPGIVGHASELMTTVPEGSAVSIDAVDPTGGFVRAVFDNQVGWISKSALPSDFSVRGLPSIGPDNMTPMQNFYFRSGIGGLNCDEAPSLLFIQGPNNAAVDVQVFKQPIRIESTIVLRSLPPGDQLGSELELITLSGLAILYPDTPQQIIVPPGFKATIPLCDQFASLGIEGDADEKGACGTWSAPIPLTTAELGVCTSLQDIPDNALNYTIQCPIIVNPSGTGITIAQLFFPDPSVLAPAIDACVAGELPDEICEYLGVPVP